jgi:hypothetical protein
MQVKHSELEKLYYDSAQKALNVMCQRHVVYGEELKQLEFECREVSSIYLFNLIQFFTILGVEVTYEEDRP